MPTATIDRPLVTLTRQEQAERFAAERRLRREIPVTLLSVRRSDKTYRKMDTMDDTGACTAMDHWYLCGPVLAVRLPLWQALSEEPLLAPTDFWLRDDEQIVCHFVDPAAGHIRTRLAPLEYYDALSLDTLYRAVTRLATL